MKFDIDLLEAAQNKLKINALKYPAEEWQGKAFKEENRL
jgi:hypothetical protein